MEQNGYHEFQTASFDYNKQSPNSERFAPPPTHFELGVLASWLCGMSFVHKPSNDHEQSMPKSLNKNNEK